MKKLTRINIPFAAMEYFGSNDRPPIDLIVEKIKQSHIYIGIVGSRYGSRVPGQPRSYTEFEYNYASQEGLNRLIYLQKPSSTYDDSNECPEKRHSLEKFKERLKANHTISYFTDANELAADVLGDLFDPISILLFHMPTLILERARLALCQIRERFNRLHKSGIPKRKAQDEALEFLRNYRFRFDGQFTVVNTDRKVIFHDVSRAIGSAYEYVHPEFDRILQNFVIGRSEDAIKWIDQLSSDYVLIDKARYSGTTVTDWIRFNIAPFTYFEPWDWHILVEAHNEMHGLEADRIERIFEDFEKKGWLIVKGPAGLPKSVRD